MGTENLNTAVELLPGAEWETITKALEDKSPFVVLSNENDPVVAWLVAWNFGRQGISFFLTTPEQMVSIAKDMPPEVRLCFLIDIMTENGIATPEGAATNGLEVIKRIRSQTTGAQGVKPPIYVYSALSKANTLDYHVNYIDGEFNPEWIDGWWIKSGYVSVVCLEINNLFVQAYGAAAEE